jgi:hypothetical protein
VETEQSDSGEELSPEEMQDIVVVAIARTVPEAIYLTDTLEEAEIPVVSRNDNTQGLTHHAYETRICVPRALQSKALEVVNAARSNAETRSVDNAFHPETIADSTRDVQADPVLELMFRLREADTATRAEQLEAFATEWLTSGVTSANIARYLAAAGLDLEQADALMQHIRETQGEQVSEEQKARSARGKMWMIFSGVLFVAQLMAVSGSNVPVKSISLAPILFLYGLYMVLSASGQRSPSSESSENQPK